jgi:hypothetical protein
MYAPLHDGSRRPADTLILRSGLMMDASAPLPAGSPQDVHAGASDRIAVSARLGGVPAFLAAFAAGAWVGRLAAHGRVGVQARRRQLPLRVIPGHPDGAGGLRPLGGFFLYQSLVAAVPATYLLVWLVLVAV